jgi:D-serine dehydratase
MFAHVQTKCKKIETNKRCGFHVHMSPGDERPWTVDELRSICFAIVYFEEAMLAVLPESRRNNEIVASNYVGNPKFAGLSREEC